MGSRSIGVAWYKRKDYPAIRRIMDDAHTLPVDYDTWLRKAALVVRLELAFGNDIVKVTLDPDIFAAWCRATGQRIDCHARRRYVNLPTIDRFNAADFSDRERLTPSLVPGDQFLSEISMGEKSSGEF